jgi:hypothetical protein
MPKSTPETSEQNALRQLHNIPGRRGRADQYLLAAVICNESDVGAASHGQDETRKNVVGEHDYHQQRG